MMRWLLLLIAFPLLSHAAVERLVTLGGDVTEIVYALHAEESLVARDSTSSWPPAAQKLPDVGYLRQLNAEGILALRPQLVLASAQAQPSLVLHKVQASGVKVVNVPGGESLSAIDNKVAVIAEALGKTAAGDALRQQLQQQIAAIPTQPVAKRVLFILSHGGMNTLVAGQHTAADGAIRAAGLQNAMQGFDHYRAMSQEGVAAIPASPAASSSGYSWPAVWRSYGATARRRAGCFSMSPPRRWTFTISSTCCVCSNGSPPAGNCTSAWCCMTLTSPPCGPTAFCCFTRDIWSPRARRRR